MEMVRAGDRVHGQRIRRIRASADSARTCPFVAEPRVKAAPARLLLDGRRVLRLVRNGIGDLEEHHAHLEKHTL